MTHDEYEKAVTGILKGVAAMTLATCEGGIPWATDVYFAPDGFDLVFFSSPTSRHCLNLASNPCCAVTIHTEAHSWREIKGLQMEGMVEPVATVGGKLKGFAEYLQKFPFAKELVSNPGDTVRSFNKAKLYVFRPTRIFYLDNSLGLGVRYCAGFAEGRLVGSPTREASD